MAASGGGNLGALGRADRRDGGGRSVARLAVKAGSSALGAYSFCASLISATVAFMFAGRMKGCWALLILMLVVLSSGCGTLSKLAGEEYNEDRRFYATRADFSLLYAYWEPEGQYNTACVAPADLKIATPITLIDIPFAVALDTVMFPFDACHDHKEGQAEQFWQGAFATGTIRADKAARYFTRRAQEQIRRAVASDKGSISSNVLDTVCGLAISNKAPELILALSRNPRLPDNDFDAIFRLSISNNLPEVVFALSQNPRLSEEHCRTLSVWRPPPGAGGYPDVQFYLAKNPATPVDILTELAASPYEGTRLAAEKALRTRGHQSPP